VKLAEEGAEQVGHGLLGDPLDARWLRGEDRPLAATELDGVGSSSYPLKIAAPASG